MQSMTGYAEMSFKLKEDLYNIEIRSLNSRFFDVIIKLPEELYFFEDDIKKIIQSKIKRGRINFSINCGKKMQDDTVIDIKTAKKYIKALKNVKKILKIPGDINLDMILNLPQILNIKKENKVSRDVWPSFNVNITKAVDLLVVSRNKEGKDISACLLKYLGSIETSIRNIKKKLPLVVKLQKEKLEKILKEFIPDIDLDNVRLAEELTLFASKCDVSEETSRLESHLRNFKEMVNKQGPIGKTFEFIVQEMNRETNTTGAKADNFEIAKEIISIKEELEKIREQIQNIE